MSPSRPSKDLMVRAQIHSLGGWFFLGVLVLFGALAMNALFSIALHPIIFWVFLAAFVFVICYVVDGLSERISIQNESIVEESWLRGSKRLSLKGAKQICYVHEGLNMEQGIETIRVRYRDGKEQRLPLGPFWHQHQVMKLLSQAVQSADKGIRLEEVR